MQCQSSFLCDFPYIWTLMCTSKLINLNDDLMVFKLLANDQICKYCNPLIFKDNAEVLPLGLQLHECFSVSRKASFCGFSLVFHVCYIYSKCDIKAFFSLQLYSEPDFSIWYSNSHWRNCQKYAYSEVFPMEFTYHKLTPVRMFLCNHSKLDLLMFHAV